MTWNKSLENRDLKLSILQKIAVEGSEGDLLVGEITVSRKMDTSDGKGFSQYMRICFCCEDEMDIIILRIKSMAVRL